MHGASQQVDPYQCLQCLHVPPGFSGLNESNYYHHQTSSYGCYASSPASAHYHLSAAAAGGSSSSAAAAAAAAAAGYVDAVMDVATDMSVATGVYYAGPTYPHTDLRQSTTGAAASGFYGGLVTERRPLVVDGGSAGVGGKQRKTARDEKVCGVCGDRALSYNFDAISCESCKAFFRRNAPKGLEHFKCPYDERCRMDVCNRRFCKRCRLNKCFQIGMRKEYILTDEEKAQKRMKIEANRRLRCAAEMKQQQQQRHHQQQHQEQAVVSVNAGASSAASCSELVTSVSSQTVALQHADSCAIDELLHAYRTSLETQNAAVDRLDGSAASLADLINIAELSMRRVIAMTKQIGAFRSLPQTDQIQLLKSGSIELLILRSVITFDADKQHFLDPVDDEERQAMKLEQLRLAEDGTGMFDEQMKFVRSLTVELRADETTLVLLLVLSLFSPDRDNLTNRDYVSAEQERYCLLLKRYLESRYAAPLARFMFPRLVMKLTEIRSLNEEHTHVLLKLNPDGIQPLMKEVLDLRR